MYRLYRRYLVSFARSQIRGRTLGTDTDERGMSMSVEAAIFLPALALLTAAVIFGGRFEMSRQAVDAAAAEAARAASIARTPATAQIRARAAGTAALAAHNVRCSPASISVDTSGMYQPIGSEAFTRANVTCMVSMADAIFPGIPGSVTLHSSHRSPIDRHRER